MTPDRAGGYRPLCPALRASLVDSPGRGFAPPHRFAAVPLPNSQLIRKKKQFPSLPKHCLALRWSACVTTGALWEKPSRWREGARLTGYIRQPSSVTAKKECLHASMQT